MSRVVRFADPQKGAARRIAGGQMIDLSDLYCDDGGCPAVAASTTST